MHEELLLIDCGEGTQEQVRRVGANFMRIGHVFISHLHGDHYLGLVGFISTLHLLGRTKELHVHGPAELKPIIDLQLRASRTYLRYPLHVHEVPLVDGHPVLANERVVVKVLVLDHRIPCTGFLVEERPGSRRLRADRVREVPVFMRQRVKEGEDVRFPDGRVLHNAEITLDPLPVRRYAYCSDTGYRADLIPQLHGVDLLYHEATFTEDMRPRARETMHSTAADAARIAAGAGVGRLLLGHFSSRYRDLGRLLEEARAVFPAAELAEEGQVYVVHPRSPV